MIKRFIWLSVSLLAIALTACGNVAASSNQPPGSEASLSLLTADYEDALPLELQLAYGTLNLEGTENEVDAQLAADLLPLWKAVRSLSDSDTVAAGEVQGLFKQIQETMTPEQVQAIAGMHLTRQNMAEISEKLGLQFAPGGGRFGEISPEMQATVEAARESGQAPPGGFGGGGGGFIPGGGPGGEGFGRGGEPGQANPELQATAQARRTQRSGTNPGIPAPVLDAVISYLEGKI